MDKEDQADKPPFSGLIDLLASIPGVSRLSALTILSEIGRDMSRFSTAGHLVAWRACVPVKTKAPANANAPACAKAPPG